MASVYDKAVALISKEPTERRDFEIQPLISWFKTRSQLFRSIKPEYLKDIVKNCRFVQRGNDETIIRQGDVGDCFYIILRGEVSIYNKDSVDSEEVSSRSQGIQTVTNIFPDRSVLGNFICNLGAGANFGDIALVTGDRLRTASIVANGTTDFVEVALDLYKRCVHDVLAKDYQDRVRFIQSNPVFSGWAPKYRKQLAMALYKEEYPYETTLVKQGESVSNIYFIISGQVEIRVNATLHVSQYPKFIKNSTDENSIKRASGSQKSVANELPHVRKNRRKENHSKETKLCYLGMNGSIGETEVLMDMESYLQTAVCVEQTIVLVLEMKHYDRLFVKRHPKTIETMRSALKDRLTLRLENRFSKQIPLLERIVDKLYEASSPQSVAAEFSKNGLTSADISKDLRNRKNPLIDSRSLRKIFIVLPDKSRIRSLVQTRYGDSSSNQNSRSAPQSLLPVIRNREDMPQGNDQSKIEEKYAELGLSYSKNFQIGELSSVSDAFLLHDDNKDKREKIVAEEKTILYNLEERVRSWLLKCGQTSKSKFVELRRLSFRNIDIPRSGSHVTVNKKYRRDYSSNLLQLCQSNVVNMQDRINNTITARLLISH